MEYTSSQGVHFRLYSVSGTAWEVYEEDDTCFLRVSNVNSRTFNGACARIEDMLMARERRLLCELYGSY